MSKAQEQADIQRAEAKRMLNSALGLPGGISSSAIDRTVALAAPVVDNTDARERLALHMDEAHGVLLLASEISDIENIITPCSAGD